MFHMKPSLFYSTKLPSLVKYIYRKKQPRDVSDSVDIKWEELRERVNQTKLDLLDDGSIGPFPETSLVTPIINIVDIKSVKCRVYERRLNCMRRLRNRLNNCLSWK